MALNIENAFTYPLKDTGWKKKVSIGGFLLLAQVFSQIFSGHSKEITAYLKTLPPSELAKFMPWIIAFLVFGILLTFLGIFTSGYFSKNANLRIMHPEAELPVWEKWGELFKIGLKAFSAICIYTIVLCTLIAALTALLMCVKTPPMLVGIIVMLSVLPILILYTVVLSISGMAFVTDLNFKSFFNFTLMKNLLKNNVGEFFLVILLGMALGVLYSIIAAAMEITIVGILVLPFISFYQMLITSDLSAQFIRNSLDKQKAKLTELN